MNLEELKEALLRNEEFKKEYSKYDLAFEIAEMVTDARIKLGITQGRLADLVGTKQPSIARLENGDSLPSLSFLEKIARKMGTYLIAPKFAFLEDSPDKATGTFEAAKVTSALLTEAYFSYGIPELVGINRTETSRTRGLKAQTLDADVENSQTSEYWKEE